MSGTHSILAPSSAARAIQCPASVTAEALYPETEQSEESAEGDAAHWAAAEMLQGRVVDVGQQAPNGWFLTLAMIQGADLYYDDVVNTLAPFGLTPSALAVEVSVQIPQVHPLCHGTPDARAWVPGHLRGGRPLLIVWDYKFGFGVVEVHDNAQLTDYVSGCLSSTNLSDLDVDVLVKIVQPRAHHRDGSVRAWSFPAGDLRGAINIRQATAAEALGPNPRAMVGPECEHCNARHACLAIQRAGYGAARLAYQAQPFDLSPEACGLELSLLTEASERLTARISGLEAQAMSYARGGKRVLGYTVEVGQGRTAWTRPASEVIALGRQLFAVDLAKPAEAITPKQAVEAGMSPEMAQALSTTPRGAAKLVRDDGSRARAIFGAKTT